MRRTGAIVLTCVAAPVALHALLVYTMYTYIAEDWRLSMSWMGVAIIDVVGLLVLGDPGWTHDSAEIQAWWFLLVGIVQWSLIGLLVGILVVRCSNESASRRQGLA